MRIGYAGTPPFAVPALEALHAAGHEVALVLTQPDRPAGRGLKLTPSAVAECAARLALRVEKPPTLKAAEAQALVADARLEVLVVAAYGLILPPAVLSLPTRGCLNIHASLLPRWRGAAPIHRAILAGDPRTGVCIMKMDAGLDTGPVVLERAIDIAPDDTTGTLTARLAGLGAAAIVEALAGVDVLIPHPQDESRATYAAKVRKDEARIDWREDAAAIARRIRAFDPQPGTEAAIAGETVKVWRAHAVEGRGQPGEVLATAPALVVACGSGALRIEQLQRPGGRRIAAAEFVHANRTLEASARSK